MKKRDPVGGGCPFIGEGVGVGGSEEMKGR